ncbi:MAG: cysteine desulfurase [Proteobacteria bacterium]|nr:cysteine desulfurase [Pseudomonadota bacterium]
MTAEQKIIPARTFDIAKIRSDFPILAKPMSGKHLTFLDSGASSQKPQAGIDAISHVYDSEYANIHRGVYELSQKATAAYDRARKKVQTFVGAASAREIIFTRNATEGINLVAQSWGRNFLKEGDQVILSEMEHHANIVPWQLLRDQIGIEIVVAPITDTGELDWDAFKNAFTSRTRLVGMTHVSNALGTITPITEIVRVAHDHGAKVLVDGSQAIPHMPVNVAELDADFYVFTGHKMYGPTGVGVLYAKAELLEAMQPYQGGGDMIASVTFEKTTYADIPQKFEAGTPNIAGTIGLGAAVDYMNAIDWDAAMAQEQALLAYATEQLQAINSITIYGTAAHKAGIVSFAIEGVHPHDVGTILDFEGIAVRAGHHCAQPVMDKFGVPATTRASFGLHNDFDDVDALVKGVHKVLEIFS